MNNSDMIIVNPGPAQEIIDKINKEEEARKKAKKKEKQSMYFKYRGFAIEPAGEFYITLKGLLHATTETLKEATKKIDKWLDRKKQ